ncbi:MAG TPA: ornithine cyclodeaminase family protein [Steroidobacteraceae bacterium]|nr:ornithine cyclodeaminase family protein [Steroidobacteraceae bacterium]
MRVFTADDVAAALPYERLIDALDRAFRSPASVPARSFHTIPVPNGSDGFLVLMPAWATGRHACVKIATVFPGNKAQGLPTVQAQVLLLDASNGSAIALFEGGEITRRRTAAASALAARYLARSDARELLVVGTGALAPYMASAHAQVRHFERILVWGRHPAKAEACARLIQSQLPAHAVAATIDLESAARGADVISCATTSAQPLVKGQWLKDGAHLDLVGSFSASTREADSDAVERSRVFVDTYQGARDEAGDLLIPIAEGRIAAGHIAGDLAELVCGRVAARTSERDVTLFKSVGTAIEDLIAAETALISG